MSRLSQHEFQSPVPTFRVKGRPFIRKTRANGIYIYIYIYIHTRFSFHAGITVAGLPLYPVRFLSRRLFSADSSLALNLAAGSPPGDVLRARNQLPRLSPRGRAASGVSGSPTCDRVRGCPCATYRWGIKRMARQLSTRELMASFFFFFEGNSGRRELFIIHFAARIWMGEIESFLSFFR